MVPTQGTIGGNLTYNRVHVGELLGVTEVPRPNTDGLVNPKAGPRNASARWLIIRQVIHVTQQALVEPLVGASAEVRRVSRRTVSDFAKT